MLWKLDRGLPHAKFRTNHTSNIIGIKFLPQCANQKLITGGLDGIVEVHNLSNDLKFKLSSEQLYCHLLRVKYVEVEPMNPNVFFSCGEDGCSRQYDLRLPFAGCIPSLGEKGQGSMFDSKNCIISTNIHTLSIKVNPVDVNAIVIASGDSKIRLYDRRMLNLCTAESATRHKPFQIFCPSHLVDVKKARCTYAEFSPCGQSIVASYHGDHSYLFDVNGISIPGAADTMDSTKLGISYPAPLPWRQSYYDKVISSKCSAMEKVQFATDNIVAGTRLIDIGNRESQKYATIHVLIIQLIFLNGNLGMNVLGYNLFSRAKEMCSTALAHPIDPGEVPIVVETLVRSLEMRATTGVYRGFKGDVDAALMDIKEALQLQPLNYHCILRKADCFFKMQRFELALEQIDIVESIVKDRQVTMRPSDKTEILNDIQTFRDRVRAGMIQSKGKQKDGNFEPDLGSVTVLEHQIDCNRFVPSSSSSPHSSLTASMGTDIGSGSTMSHNVDPYRLYSDKQEELDVHDALSREKRNRDTEEVREAVPNIAQRESDESLRPQKFRGTEMNESDGSASVINRKSTLSSAGSSLTSTSSFLGSFNSTNSEASLETALNSSKYQHSNSYLPVMQTVSTTEHYRQRFVGASNVTSDLKETIFLGSNGEVFIATSFRNHLLL